MGKSKARYIATMALLLAISVMISIVEHQLPPLPPPFPPQLRVGFANIVVMYVQLADGAKPAYSITLLKALFVLMQRGVLAAGLSLCGGLLAVSIVGLLLWVFRQQCGYLLLGVAGAIAHNIGQALAVSVAYQMNMVLLYLPVLLLGGVVAGSITALLLKIAVPYIQKCRTIDFL